MDAAYGDGRPPPELRLAWMCERYHSLPESGGLLDQDAATVGRMVTFSNVHSTLQRWQNLQGAAIHNLTESERRVLRSLRDMKVWMVDDE